jgi:hypothetical protein
VRWRRLRKAWEREKAEKGLEDGVGLRKAWEREKADKGLAE